MQKGVIDWTTMNSQAQVILDEIGAPFKSDVLVKSLGPAERHLVEISRALSQEAGVKFVVCQMTVELFGFSHDDFIEGMDYVGAASFLPVAQKADVTLFI